MNRLQNKNHNQAQVRVKNEDVTDNGMVLFGGKRTANVLST